MTAKEYLRRIIDIDQDIRDYQDEILRIRTGMVKMGYVAYGYSHSLVETAGGGGMYCDMVTRCDEIWLAPGWTNSRGCVREYETARLAEIKVVYLSADGHAGVEV